MACASSSRSLFGLLKDEPNAAHALRAVQERISRVVSLLVAGDPTAGAREFVDAVAFGAGAWLKLSEETRDTFVSNAPTWRDETQDPESLELDPSGLREFTAPALLTLGDQSLPFFARVVYRIATAMPHATTHTYVGAGHVPHLSHPEEYVRVVAEFSERAVSRMGLNPPR